VTLFTEHGATVSAAFKDESRRETYRSMIADVLGSE
jgi:hypothetical protein